MGLIFKGQNDLIKDFLLNHSITHSLNPFMQQLTDTILMIRPIKFGYNVETAENNHYQQLLMAVAPEEIQRRARAEFDQFVNTLRANKINIITVDDTAEQDTPDSIFPNNWISFHDDGTVVTYPMWAPTVAWNGAKTSLTYYSVSMASP